MDAAVSGRRVEPAPLLGVGVLLVWSISVLALGAYSLIGRAWVAIGCGLLGAAAVWTTSRIGGLSPRGWLWMNGLAAVAVGQLLATLVGLMPHSSIAALSNSAVLLVAYALFLLAALDAAGVGSGLRLVLLALVAVGFAESAYGVLNLLVGNSHLLIYKRYAYFDSATGTLVNRNHFAYLLELCIPVAVAMFSLQVRHEPTTKATASEERAKSALFGIAIAVMVLALLLSRSRMGAASLALAAMLTAFAGRRWRPAQAPSPAATPKLATLGLAAVTVLLVLLAGIDIAVERFGTSASDLEAGRLPIWRDTLRMIAANPIFGTGLGAYDHAVSGYREDPSGVSYVHAHSDYLEILAEAGAVGLAVVLTWIILFLRRFVRHLRTDRNEERRAYVLATATGILSVILHSTVEFGLRMPGVALTLLVVVAAFLRLTEAQAPAAKTSHR